MKNKVLTGGLLLVIMALSIVCNQKKEETKIDKKQIKAEIQAIEDQFALIYNTLNADSISYYADDAISYFNGQEPIVGKPNIHRHIQYELMDFPEGAEISFRTLEIYVTEDGNHVVEIGEHRLVDSVGAVLQRGHYFSLFAKRDGKYVCIRDMANSVRLD